MEDIRRIPIFGKCPEITDDELKEMDEDIKRERQLEKIRAKASHLMGKKRLTASERADLDDAENELAG